MKRLFNHTKRPTREWEQYDENEYDWDEPEYYEEDEYYAEDSEEYYAEDSGEYYAEDGGEYYAEDSEEYYAEDGGEYYAEESGEYYTEDDGEYYAEEDEAYYEPEEGVYYAEDNQYYEEPVKATRPKKPAKRRYGKQNVLILLWDKFMEMAVMDRVITVTGIAVLLMALVTGGVYLGSRMMESDVDVLAGVGSQLEGITLIGEEGLLAVADAQIARQEAAELLEQERQEEEEREEQKDYNEGEYSNAVTVKLNMTSVKKDLKIKFTNKKTGKLIGNVPFSVTVTKPDGTSVTWSDDDMDGIIYHKDIEGGTYKVLVNELTGEKYKDYTIPTGVQSVEVKKDIVYEKVDVSDEVVTEDQIDVSKEDTQIKDTVVESTLQDTVTWVESTAVAETYTEVSKTTIPDPLTLAITKSFLRIAQQSSVSDGDVTVPGENVAFTATVAPTETTLAIGDTVQAKVTPAGATEGSALVYSVVSNNAAVATATIDQQGNIAVVGVAAGTATVTATVNYAEGTSMPVTAVLKVTVLDKPVLTLDKTTATVYLTEPLVINAKVINALTETPVTAESSDAKVATVAVTDKEITITGVAEGDATITVKYKENDQELTATCVVKVKIHPKEDKVSLLKDAEGNQLYVQEGEKYREALYADYYTATKFFIKGDVKYTGWQTIEGNVYYFTAAGEKVTGEQVIQGAKYNFASDGSLITGSGTLGIDVSKWNGTIDWKAVKNSGISYVIIRCGYRGSSEGKLIEDPKFKNNIKGALEAGLKVGVYFFTQATDEIEAVEEASFVLDQIKNYKISYPVFLDVEPSGGRGDKIDKTTRTAVCKAFCETIQRSGYTAGIYANKTWLNDKIDTASLSAYKIWLAQYAATPTYTGRYDLWQYTSTGKVSGIKGDVDLNLSYLGY